MVDPQTQPQIEGLPPGAILKPIPQPAISGLPPGAILKPIGNSSPETPASMLTVPQQMDRAANRDYGQTSMSAGTQTFEQAHPSYVKTMGPKGALTRFAQGAGIPTSQAENTEAMQGLLTPQADPNDTGILYTAEQIPIVGGDVRARAALAKRAANETGATAIAHKIAAVVPFVGPAIASAQDKYDQGDYAGTLGASLNAAGAAEGVKGAIKPKPTVLEGSRPAAAINQPELPASAGTYTGPPVNAPVPATALSKILGGGPESMAKKPLAGATAAGKASNAEVAAYAKSKGIDLLPGQATGARGLQALQAEGERAIVIPGELPEVLDKQKAAFGNAVDDFNNKFGAEAIPNTEAAGQSLKSQTQAGLDNLKSSAQSDYQGFQQQAGDIPVDLSDVKAKALSSLASQNEALRNTPPEYANPIKGVLNKLAGLEAGPEADPRALADYKNAVETYGLNPEQQSALRQKLGIPEEGANTDFKMSTAQQLRSAYLDISRDYTGNVPKSVQRYAAQAAKDIDAAMSKAADQVGATQQWRQANAKWKQLQETYNNSEHPLYKVLQEPDPSEVPSKLLGKGNYGGSPQTVRQLQQAGIDISPLKREVAQQIADGNFKLTKGGRGLGGYSTEFLQTLYSPEEFKELTMLGRVGRSIRFEMNPSGTSNVTEAGRTMRAIVRHAGPLGVGAGTGFIFGGPIGALAGGVLAGAGDALIPSIASRLTTSKALARAAMGDIPAAPRGVLDILGSRGPEPPPEPPPASGAPSTPPAPGTPPVAPEAKGMAAAAPLEERRADLVTRKRVADMSPEERAQALLTSDKTGLPNRRAFDESQPAKAVAMSDADGLKAINDKFGYQAGDALLKAKADALKEAGLDAYHEKGDEFLYRGESPQDLKAKLDKARDILRNKTISVEMNDGSVLQFKGADFSYGTGQDLPTAETGLKANKAQREANGERARGELRGITQLGSQPGEENVSGSSKANLSGNSGQDQQSPVSQRSLSDILSGKPQEKIDLNAPKSKRKIPPDVTAKADTSGKIVGMKAYKPSASLLTKDGKPLDLFHGTKSDFSTFDLSQAGTSDPGVVGKAIYFAPTESEAEHFATSRHYGKGENQSIVRAHVSLKNPFIITDGVLPDGRTLSDVHPSGLSKTSAADFQKQIKSSGHDGVIFINNGEVGQVAAFSPSSVKMQSKTPMPEQTRSLSDILSGKKPPKKGGK